MGFEPPQPSPVPSQVWCLFGDGAFGYSLIEFDTFVRHKVMGCLRGKPGILGGVIRAGLDWGGSWFCLAGAVYVSLAGQTWCRMPQRGLILSLQIPVMALIGNDAGWTQISREQVPSLGSNVACGLAYTGEDPRQCGEGGSYSQPGCMCFLGWQYGGLGPCHHPT